MSSTSTFTLSNVNQLDTVVALLAKYKAEDYYAYERKQVWYAGLGSHTSLLVDPKGETATVTYADGKQETYPVNGSIADVARDFIANHAAPGAKVFGNVGFNYAAHSRGEPFNVGKWPLLSLMVPRATVELRTDLVIVSGVDAKTTSAVVQETKEASVATIAPAGPALPIDTTVRGEEYKQRVSRALCDIEQGKYVKVIPSRPVELSHKIDMAATLRQGRLHNSPARTFCLKHAGFEATGFSPELVALVEDGKVITEPLAGTRARVGTAEEIEKLRQDLIADPKEVVEHVLSVKEAIDELNRFCPAETVVVEDLMSVRPRGPVQHLGSRVAGRLAADKDVWDAFGVLFPSITAAGIPKNPALEAIQRLEPTPRELYSGAVLMLEGPVGHVNGNGNGIAKDKSFFEATLVLRSVFQEAEGRRWLQAGAGVITQSKPERELTETREKLASVAPYVIPAE